jgi:hypothetical protein
MNADKNITWNIVDYDKATITLVLVDYYEACRRAGRNGIGNSLAKIIV